MEKEKVDLLFLDIQMPHLTGLELIRAMTDPPLVIFVTAFPQFALEGFDLDVVDYLLKPVSFARFLKATEKARVILELRQTISGTPADYFFIKSNGKIERIITSKVLYIEGMANYVVIHTRQKKYVTYLTMSGIEEQLPADLFMRIHKSYIVAHHAIISIQGDEVITERNTLPISKNLRPGVMERIAKKMYRR